MKIQVTPEAKNDLVEIRKYITNDLQNPSAALNVIKKITKRIRKLSGFPLMGTALSSIVDIETDYRLLVCGSYSAFYRFDDEYVYIIRVLDSRRDFMRILFGIILVDDDFDLNDSD